MLELRELRAGYGRIPILDGVTLDVAAGELLGVLGHNGMGKTTLMRTIVGELAATHGSVRLDGVELTRLPPHRRARLGVGYVPQGRRIFPALTVRENLRFAAQASRAGNDVVERVLAELPALVRLLDRQGGSLSGGEQQILALARCLCTSPRLVLLDEPTEGIQPSIVEQMAALLRELHRRHGLTIVLVEQNLDFVRALAERVAVLEKGRITHVVDMKEAGAARALLELAGFPQR
ncbi:MAG TPA: ABC transporter ATP-binding protein [Zeimonas sp.]|nr:ABC transporter ATP-binding protein [Zeimonas sp.]